MAIAVALVTSLRLWMGRRFGVTQLYIVFPGVIAGAALLGGTVAGLEATLLSALAIDYYLVYPVGYFHDGSIGDRIGMGIFVCSCVSVTLACNYLRQVAMRNREQQREMALSEVRLQAQSRLHDEARLQLAAIVESSRDAIFGKTLDGTVTTWNRGAEMIFGYTAEEMIGQSATLLFPAGHDNERILDRLRMGASYDEPDILCRAKGGRPVHVSLIVSPEFDARGEVVGAATIARDITEARSLQRQLQQSQKMDAMGQFTGGIAHDFNNLLGIILGALELQHESLHGNGSALSSWAMAHGAAQRGADLTRRLLAFSSLEQIDSVNMNLARCSRNVADLARHLLGSKIDLQLQLDESLPEVMVDVSGLESALLNLVINARDAMPEGGTLTLANSLCELDEQVIAQMNGAMKPGPYACIAVTDTGTGMSPETLDRAFEPFFTTKQRGRGTGLGLSMVYGFIRQSQGGIKLHSEPGRGTTVSLYLPLSNAPLPVEAKPSVEAKGHGTASILLVDDEAGLLEMAALYLRQLDYVVHTARNGPEALELLPSLAQVDVMVTDVIMGGGMDGMELAHEVIRQRPQVQVVYSSGFSANALSDRSLPLANSLILQKPYRLLDLAGTVSRALEGRHGSA